MSSQSQRTDEQSLKSRFSHWGWSVLRHFPLLVFLASVGLLIEHAGKLAMLDDLMSSFVVSLHRRDAQNDLHIDGRFTALLVSDAMFKKHLRGTLPIPRDLLARLIDRVVDQSPAVLAIDVDSEPAPVGSVEQGAPATGALPPVFVAIRRALDKGVSVVAAIQPAKEADEGAACSSPHDTVRRCSRPAKAAGGGPAWLKQLCALNGAATAEPSLPARGRLLVANAILAGHGARRSAIMYPNPLRDPTTLAAGKPPEKRNVEEMRQLSDPRRPPLSIGVAAALLSKAAPCRHRLEAVPDACAMLTIANRSHQRVAADAHDGECPADEARWINYARMPMPMAINDSDDIAPLRAQLQGRVVVLGVDSFQNFDQHVTPIGLQTGAAIHTAIAVSTILPLEPSHGVAFALDFALGAMFLAIGAALPAEPRPLRRVSTPHVLAVWVLLRPLIPAVCVLFAVVLLSPQLMERGWWVNPLFIVLGLMTHMYVGLVSGHHCVVPGLLPWLREIQRQARRALRKLACFRRTPFSAAVSLRAVDGLLWLAYYAAMFIALGWALSLIFHLGN